MEFMARRAGVVLPLFSIRTRRDWGIGQLTDLPLCARWIARSGHSLLQVLPPHELAIGETSPYGALTAFAIDPIYADIEAVADLDDAAIVGALGQEGQAALGRLRALPRVDYRHVRVLKSLALDAAFERFLEREWAAGSPRAKRLQKFIDDEAGWLADFALYSALRASRDGWGWSTWPGDERDRRPERLAALRRDLDRAILQVSYVQWTLLEQWAGARAAMKREGVELMGDLPFVVGEESADVWARPHQFQLAMSLGAPPDDFSAEGQEWGLPPYDWAAMERDDLAWVRARVRHAARLYDRFRLDHVVGFFRQWVRPKHEKGGRFDPQGEPAQQARGLRVLAAMLDEVSAVEPGSPPRIIAEDLGVVPTFVREGLREMGLPGYRVLPWEKDDDVFRDPATFPASSVASWSTHDTAPITAWWDDLPEGQRAALAERAGVPDGADDAARTLALLGDLYASGSDLVLVLAQELLADRSRLNTPATVSENNWTWRFPRPLEDLEADPALAARMDAIRLQVERSGRGPGSRE
jgi:4-alpha-glucanotransferase